MSSFTKPLVVKVETPPVFILEEEFEYYRTGDKNDIIKIPKGFDTDFASIPRIFWSFLPPTGTKRNQYSKAAVLHDWVYDELCEYPVHSRKDCDKIFLEAMAAFLKKHEDGVLLFYDSEFGSPKEYFQNFDVDTKRVLHCPITNIEELKFDLMAQLDNIQKGDKVMILIDSIGNLASKKEVEDAKNEKSVADMSRAKQLKSLFRMVTPHLTLKDIQLVAVNHTYESQSLYPQTIVGGGTGIQYSSNDIWIVGRSQNKDNDGSIAGYNFTINIDKSRKVKEKSKIEINVTYENGISKFSNMLDLAIEYGAVQKAPAGWYIRKGSDTKCREKDLYTDEWLESLLGDEGFKEFVRKKYKL